MAREIVPEPATAESQTRRERCGGFDVPTNGVEIIVLTGALSVNGRVRGRCDGGGESMIVAARCRRASIKATLDILLHVLEFALQLLQQLPRRRPQIAGSSALLRRDDHVRRQGGRDGGEVFACYVLIPA